MPDNKKPDIPEFDKRAKRLVTMQVDVKVVTRAGAELEGVTTGLNQHGLGARVKVIKGTFLKEAKNIPVTVKLNLPRKDLSEITGVVLRSAGSWVPGFDHFIAVSFDSISLDDIEYLKQFIKWREDRYFKTDAPQRSWNIFKTKTRKHFGPLRTPEVLEAIEKEEFTMDDWVWDGAASEWVQLKNARIMSIIGKGSKVPAHLPGRDAKRARLIFAILLFSLYLGFEYYDSGLWDTGAAKKNYAQGVGFEREGKIYLAIQKYDEILKKYPDSRWNSKSTNRIEYLQEILKQKKEVDLAKRRLTELQKREKKFPDHPFLLNSLGDCYYKLGDYPKAEDYFKRALKKIPDSGKYLYNLATTLLTEARYKEALEMFSTAGDKLQNDMNFHFNKGLVHIALNNKKEALLEFDRCVKIDPANQNLKSRIKELINKYGLETKNE